ncbi:MAG: hypothetical protein ACLGGX_07650 [Bdellovibrionia bacterium]
MKAITTLILALVVSTQAQAWIAKSPVEKEYSFKFRLQQETLEIRKKAASYEDAFETAAQECFNHFKNGEKLSEDRGLDIIDVCANPRS